jgi:hypothetical protein
MTGEGPPYVHTLGATRRPAFTVRRLLPAWEPPWPPMRGPVPAGRPCATCTFKRVPPVFPLPPFEPYEPQGERMPYRIEFYGLVPPMPYPPFPLSSII